MDEAGEDLDEPFLVVFDVDVAEGKEAAAAKALASASFDVSEEPYDSETVIEASRSMLVTPQNLKAARADILRAIAPFGGTYEGWGIDPDEEGADDLVEDDED
jgi:Regulator of ribonuclease activity B